MKFKLPEQLNFMQVGRMSQKTTTESLKGKIVVVSGATSGVGLATLWQLAKADAHIVMVVRNKDKAEKVKMDINGKYDVNIDIFIADFSKLADINKVANELLDTYKQIDVLINSVGIHSTKKKYNEEGIEMCFCVNHLSVFLLTKLLLDRMIDSAPSRIIQVNSEGHRFCSAKPKDVNFRRRLYYGLRGYGASKTAQLLTTWDIFDELKGTGVTINAVHPGAVKSNIGGNNGFLYRWWMKHVTSKFLKDPELSGKALYYLAAEPSLKEVSGLFFNLTNEEKPANHALNREKGKLMTKISLEMTGLIE